MERIEIRLNKKRMLLYTITAVLFTVCGALFIISPAEFETPNGNYNPLYLLLLGCVMVLFWGATMFFGSKKMFDSKPGLVIDDRGIHDNTSATGGLIDWQDVAGLKTLDLGLVKSIIVELSDPEKYIERGSNAMAKRGLKQNYKQLGSPIVINAAALKIKHDDLMELLQKELIKRNGNGVARDTIKPESEK